jgi:hypothetical protein
MEHHPECSGLLATPNSWLDMACTAHELGFKCNASKDRVATDKYAYNPTAQGSSRHGSSHLLAVHIRTTSQHRHHLYTPDIDASAHLSCLYGHQCADTALLVGPPLLQGDGCTQLSSTLAKGHTRQTVRHADHRVIRVIDAGHRIKVSRSTCVDDTAPLCSPVTQRNNISHKQGTNQPIPPFDRGDIRARESHGHILVVTIPMPKVPLVLPAAQPSSASQILQHTCTTPPGATRPRQKPATKALPPLHMSVPYPVKSPVKCSLNVPHSQR